tara:strand:- start:709 stop:3036 length:2328 start_codon:yes stop_codon:yes gene_type:complete
MYVVKRDGRHVDVSFDKISNRITRLCYNLNMNYINIVQIAQKCISGLYKGMKTSELDILAAETSAYLVIDHPDYAILAARIIISNLHKETKKTFSEVIEDLYNYKDQDIDKSYKLISDDVYDIIMKNKDKLDSAIIYDRDYNYDYFGFKTLEKSYLLKINDKIVERPQHLLMRVSIGIHKDNIDDAINTYNLMSQKFFTHASPTLFNSGTPRPQLSSCFLIDIDDDSIEGIYDTQKECALISKMAGGIGMAIHKIRSKGSYISGTNGTSNGIIPMLRVFNATARYVDQGGGKRPGAIAVFLEPWHPDIFDFIDLRKNTGNEENRCRDLFLGLWIPDLFMKRVKNDEMWSLMCPSKCPHLYDKYGSEFEELYVSYENQGRFIKQIRAQELWNLIIDAQIETGTPYILFKDSANEKSNQKNIGTIKSSNLCCEIMEYTDPNETAVCNLASIGLPMFVNDGHFNFEKLREVTKTITFNLNKVIDVNYYPVSKAKHSNLKHRPIGIGIQGLADVFMILKLPFESDGAFSLNKKIFETIYYSALEASMELAQKDGYYDTFKGSPASKGILQFDMWGVEVSDDMWNWTELKQNIMKYGLRNSLLIAPMPTASTSQILGNNECFEPYTANIYSRRVMSGDFIIINPYLLQDLINLNLWNENMKNTLLHHKGSVQNIPEIPDELKQIYKTVWEVKMRSVINMASDRGAFIDQSQSLNLFLENPTRNKITSMLFHAWSKGLKTGCYYLRTRPAVDAIQFTVDQSKVEKELQVCTMEEGCISCSG